MSDIFFVKLTPGSLFKGSQGLSLLKSFYCSQGMYVKKNRYIYGHMNVTFDLHLKYEGIVRSGNQLSWASILKMTRKPLITVWSLREK